MAEILVTTTNFIEGHRIVSYKGIVTGIIVRAPTFSQSLFASMKQSIGGNIGPFMTMCEEARSAAFQIMLKQARELEANAIISIRYDASEINTRKGSATEVFCYGTAVLIEPDIR